ncbi:unnamed protein product [Kuraishia capsulata CBS 1993]|uniref:Protein HIR n=1 Tax=Kuraishia capsulata CBS 1993 TaxID=1382522 RepID=W6MSH7_9ASCO|nr:uncharacterized protein KUCA_T00004148001 [Kuraishia capsulata CBS 1993]CDK28167.1 unnamed protein product [Kuraishia capsulata CBS 1993]
MHILKLPWLCHQEEHRKFEVYSVSISSDGKRLATGGLDGKIKIWSVASILRYTNFQQGVELAETADPRSSLTRPLCSMSRHTGAVTTVRFSPSGRFLASGSDDKIVLIWEKDEEASRAMGATIEHRLNASFGDQAADLEHWTVRKRLVAHDNDIQDMAWAPDSSILVTVGLDRSIIVWNGTTFEKIKRFDIHQSHVKGVVFDPANKYFATASDDRTMRIFRYHRTSPTDLTFSLEHVVVDPFKKSPLSTYFRRCSWSPDGQHIAAPNAANGPVTSVAIVNRGNWASDISLIGHDAPCEVVAFSPRLFEVEDAKKDDDVASVLATAGQDKSLVIWKTDMARPLLIASEVCYKAITDMVWTPDGSGLFLSSLDGTITAIQFEENELGKVIPLERNDAQLHRYGVDRESMVFPESVEQLLLEEKAELLDPEKGSDHLKRLMGQDSAVLVSPRHPRLSPKPDASPKKQQPAVNLTLSSQKVTITKGGKKRVAPLLLSASSAAQKPKIEFKKTTKAMNSLLSQPSYRLPRFGLQTAVSALRDELVIEPENVGHDDNAIDTIEQISQTKIQPAKGQVSSKKRKEVEYPQYLRNATLCPTTVFADHKNQPSILLKVAVNGTNLLEIRNSEDDENEYTRVLGHDSVRGRTFELFTPNKIIACVGHADEYWVLASETGSIMVISSNGRQLLPTIEVGSPVPILKCNGSKLLAVTSLGEIFTWDLVKQQAIALGVSLSPILNHLTPLDRVSSVPNVERIELTPTGLPLVMLETGDAYSWSPDLLSWIEVAGRYYISQLEGVDRLKSSRYDMIVRQIYRDVKRDPAGSSDKFWEIYERSKELIGEN